MDHIINLTGGASTGNIITACLRNIMTTPKTWITGAFFKAIVAQSVTRATIPGITTTTHSWKGREWLTIAGVYPNTPVRKHRPGEEVWNGSGKQGSPHSRLVCIIKVLDRIGRPTVHFQSIRLIHSKSNQRPCSQNNAVSYL